MSNRFDALAQQLTGKSLVEECSVEELRHLSQRHPYFSAGQLLYLQKLQQINSPDWEEQYQKAILFYHDPLLFQHFISTDKFYKEEEQIAAEPDVTATVMPFVQKEAVSQDSVEAESFPVQASDLVKDDSSKDEAEGILEHHYKTQAGTAAEKQDDQLQTDHETAPHQEILSGTEVADQKHEITESPEAGPDLKNPTADQQQNTVQIPADELVFEPFHTVDYFASQGIKISQEEAPKDKLGKQLKSFTQWLKTMKRLPSTQVTETLESSAEQKVESMATDSVTQSEVVTEAMAEVWAKQGNTGKALAIYTKLSLLNPSKTAYFAAKIENLKTS